MRKKKNGFMTFIFSFIPGCAEMYWGYMKNGVSILALFCASVFLSGIFGNGAFMLLAVVMYAYAFFHARNMAHMSDEEFAETEDAYLISEEMLKKAGITGKKYHRFLAAVLIVCGCWFLLDTGLYLLRNIFPAIQDAVWMIQNSISKIFAAAILIGIGIRLIRGKKEQEDAE